MRVIQYAYIVEDEAQAIFLEKVLPQIIQYFGKENMFTFQKDIAYASTNALIVNDRNQVDALFANAAIESIISYQDDVFFIGRDTDHTDSKIIWEKCMDIYTKIDTQIRARVQILFPEQCIEYWLRYLKWCKLNPYENVAESFETSKKRAIKNNLYGGSRNKKDIITELCENINIKFLSDNSRSFSWFLIQLERFLNNLT